MIRCYINKHPYFKIPASSKNKMHTFMLYAAARLAADFRFYVGKQTVGSRVAMF